MQMRKAVKLLQIYAFYNCTTKDIKYAHFTNNINYLQEMQLPTIIIISKFH